MLEVAQALLENDFFLVTVYKCRIGDGIGGNDVYIGEYTIKGCIDKAKAFNVNGRQRPPFSFQFCDNLCVDKKYYCRIANPKTKKRDAKQPFSLSLSMAREEIMLQKICFTQG